ncbi:Nucleosome assembly protein (NAP) [Parasponia andersonii]|uniref:Nucleosome assembly protein (NAP) n=1 Tax=Parasponia andersonii TaxID=3476 RepID=A0A2P5BH99_PARAD|nr:Nucleosome assembly protein (NAP) [Parasponia andersonii]
MLLQDRVQSSGTGKRSDVLETLTPGVRKRVEVLREIQGQHDELEAKFFEERAALEAKYQKLYEPFYTKRYEIVNGIVEVDRVTNETAMDQGDKVNEDHGGVPEFWLNAMKTNKVLAEEISELDEGALKYLKDIKWCKIENPKGFKVDFFFDPNPYFKNSVLTKTYHMVEDDHKPVLEKAIGTEIEWYPGGCSTKRILTKKLRKSSGSKNANAIIKTENCPSFFNFFNPPQIPEDDDDYFDEEDGEDLKTQMEQDYDIG